MFDYDAEVALLSILMKNKDAWVRLTKLEFYMLSSASHRTIFEAIKELIFENLDLELNLIITHLKSKKLLDDAGGQEYLQFLFEQQYPAENLREYERIVINNYKASSLLTISSGIKSRIETTSNIDSLIVQFRESLDNLLTSTVMGQTFHIDQLLEDSLQEIKLRGETKTSIGVATGYNGFDTLIGGYVPGDLWTICGRPGMAKSAMVCNNALRMARNGKGSLIFSLEMSKEQLLERLVSIESGVSIINIRTGNINEEELEVIANTLDSFRGLPIYIDTNYMADVNYIETIMRLYHKRHGIVATYLDNINLMVERDTNSTHALGQVSRRCKLLSQELNLTNIIIAQLNRQVESRPDKRPILPDIRQSGNIEEDSDVVIGLFRDEYYTKENTQYPGILEAIILKHRNGPLGTITLGFRDETNSIYDRKK
jgi:replicative DNA helicase